MYMHKFGYENGGINSQCIYYDRNNVGYKLPLHQFRHYLCIFISVMYVEIRGNTPFLEELSIVSYFNS